MTDATAAPPAPGGGGPTRVLLVDDQALLRMGFRLVLEGEDDLVVVGEAGDGAAAVQQAIVQTGPRAGQSVARAIIDDVHSFNQEQTGSRPFGSIGLVLGATVELADYGIDVTTAGERTPGLPVLAPGFGHQGARVEDAARLFGSLASGAIVSESRGLLSAGPRGLGDAVARRAEEVRAAHV